MTFRVRFFGYYTDRDRRLLPSEAGLYVIHIHSPTSGKLKILYIGQAKNLAVRLGPRRLLEWRKVLRRGEQLLLSIAPFRGPRAHRERVEAALIHQHKPVLNIQHVETFAYGETTIRTKGTADLSPNFTVCPTDSRWECKRDLGTSRVVCNRRENKAHCGASEPSWWKFWG